MDNYSQGVGQGGVDALGRSTKRRLTKKAVRDSYQIRELGIPVRFYTLVFSHSLSLSQAMLAAEILRPGWSVHMSLKTF